MNHPDLYHGTTVFKLNDPQSITDTNNDGTGVDVTGMTGEAVAILNYEATAGGETVDMAIQQSTTLGGTYTALTDEQDVAVAITQIAASQDAGVRALRVPLNGCSGFIRAVVTVAGTVIVSAVLVAGGKASQPETA
jgi:hypothetical protein